AIAIFQALVERFAFLDYANSLQDVGYLFGLNNDCLALCFASPSNASQFVLGKPFANVTLSETCFPLFTIGVCCPCCQEQRTDTGYEDDVLIAPFIPILLFHGSSSKLGSRFLCHSFQASSAFSSLLRHRSRSCSASSAVFHSGR